MEASWWERLTVGETGSCSDGWAMPNTSLIQFSVDGWGCVPSLLFDLRLKLWWRWRWRWWWPPSKGPMHTTALSAPSPAAGHCQPMPPPEPPGHSRASLGQSFDRSLLLSPGSWCAQGSVCALLESVSPVLCKFCNQIPLAAKVKFSGGSQSLCQVLRLENLLWVLELS